MNLSLNDHRLLWPLIGVTVVDRGITIAYWGLESNPLVALFTPLSYLVLTTVLLLSGVVVWYNFELWSNHTTRIAVGILTAGTGIAVVSNLAVVLS